VLELKELTKNYGDFKAVDNVNLSIKKGEIFSFLGVNGAGKTTTIKMIVGLLKASSGKVLIDGIDVAKNPLEAKSITGYIPDRPQIYEGLSAYEFLDFIASLYKINNPKDQILELLEKYQLTEDRNELIETFSHGMKQRLAMCSALLPKPRLLVVDEPMVGLDPHGAKLLKESFKQYAKEGMSIFLSTHSLGVAEELSDRISLINKGKIIAVGNLEELRKKAGEENSNDNSSSLEQVFLQLTNDAYT